MGWPWRKETDPFWKAVAEILLIRTTRKAAARAYLRLKQVFPSSREVAIAKEEEIRGLIKEVGLLKRAKAIKTLAEKVSSGEDVYRALSQTPQVGKYVLGAFKLYALGEREFPVDGNIRRFFGRALGIEPLEVESLLARLLAEVPLDTDVLRNAHLAVLDIAWEFCHGKAPKCWACPVREYCSFPKTRRVQGGSEAKREKASSPLPQKRWVGPGEGENSVGQEAVVKGGILEGRLLDDVTPAT